MNWVSVFVASVITVILFFVGYFFYLPKSFFRTIELLFPQVICFFPGSTSKRKTKFQTCLTINLCPGPTKDVVAVMKGILELLETNQGVKVTFFVVCDPGWIKGPIRPLLLTAIRQGHCIANHGGSADAAFLIPDPEFQQELRMATKEIQSLYVEALGPRSIPTKRWYRPVRLLFTPAMVDICRKQQCRLVLGSVYPHDTVLSVFHPRVHARFIAHKLESNDVLVLDAHEKTRHILAHVLCRFPPNLVCYKTLQET